jgi:hypothetical protein
MVKKTSNPGMPSKGAKAPIKMPRSSLEMSANSINWKGKKHGKSKKSK